MRIFDKFYQGDRLHSTAGNGLGLAIVKKIIEDNKNRISVRQYFFPAEFVPYASKQIERSPACFRYRFFISAISHFSAYVLEKIPMIAPIKIIGATLTNNHSNE